MSAGLPQETRLSETAGMKRNSSSTGYLPALSEASCATSTTPHARANPSGYALLAALQQQGQPPAHHPVRRSRLRDSTHIAQIGHRPFPPFPQALDPRTFTKVNMATDSRPFHVIICPVLLRQQIRFCSVAHTEAKTSCTRKTYNFTWRMPSNFRRSWNYR